MLRPRRSLKNLRTWDRPRCGGAGRLPTTSGNVNFDTLGSDFDTILAIYTGTGDLADLALLAENDDDDGNISSKVTFSATAGTTYLGGGYWVG